MFEEIKTQITNVIAFSQGISDPYIDEIFNNWYNAKLNFIKAMNNELRVCIPNIKVHLNEDERMRRLNNFISHIDEDYEAYKLAGFLDRNKDSFYDNKVSYIPTWMYDNGNLRESYKSIKIGMKLLRSFKYFTNELDEITIDKIQTEASMLIQENVVEGDLYLSVHPLDYLSSSENTYHWRSCHALDGEYRCGNLSYMCDKSTLICYLAGKENKKLPHFPDSVLWNSKKWRMLLHVSDNWDMIFAGRQYPFSSTYLMDVVREFLIKKEIFKGNWSPWSNYQLTDIAEEANNYFSLQEKYLPVAGKLITLKEIVKEPKHATHFNDILYSTIYKPYYIKKVESDDFFSYENVSCSDLKFNIGSNIKCLCCNKNTVKGHGMMVCPECDLKFYQFKDEEDYICCAICGDIAYTEDSDLYGENDDIICEHCRDNLAFRCDRCGRFFLYEDSRKHSNYENLICFLCEEDIEVDD